jgi:membrane fusion protein (multidrug efflux system)
VLVVNADKHVELRDVQLEAAPGNQWRVLAGLRAGERVIVQGQQKVRPGDLVSPVVVDRATLSRG